jgi:hypothetical protein
MREKADLAISAEAVRRLANVRKAFSANDPPTILEKWAEQEIVLAAMRAARGEATR